MFLTRIGYGIAYFVVLIYEVIKAQSTLLLIQF